METWNQHVELMRTYSHLVNYFTINEISQLVEKINKIYNFAKENSP